MTTTMVTNENIIKLRELTEKIGNSNPVSDDSLIISDLKSVLDDLKKEVSILETPNSKIKCYEKMCVKINNILNNIKTRNV